MAAKLPIIATRVGDNHLLITDKLGKLVEPEDHNQLSKTITTMLENPLRSKRLGVNGYQVVKNHYTWNQVASKYLKVISFNF